MTGVKFDYCGGCGLQKSLVLRGDLYKCMKCLTRNDDPDYGDFASQEQRELDLQSRP